MNKVLNYSELIEKYPWILQEKQNVIISPDIYGFLCGLFMSHYYNWNIVGFYDGKQMLIQQNIKIEDCIFLDMEILRRNIKSCGHHMII